MKEKTHNETAGARWPRGLSRTQRLAIARAVLEDEFSALREDASGIGHAGHACHIDMQAIAYTLIRELADDSSTSPKDCGNLHKAAHLLRRFEP